MKIKIVSIFVFALLVISVLSVEANQNFNENEASSSGLASMQAFSEIAEVKVQNNIEGLNERGLPFYGYCAMDPTIELIQGPVSFNPTTPEIIKQIAPTSSNEFISGATWAVGKWYGCEYGLGEGNPLIWTINPVIGEMTQVGSYDSEGTNLSFNGLAYNSISGIMYGCSNTDLYRVDMNTGASSWVGNFEISGGIMIAIAFDGSDNLYGIELVTDSLYSINPANGLAKQIGDGLGIDINYAQDMAFDIDTGILYLSAYTIAPVKEGALYTCNKYTGVARKIGTFQGAAEITGFAIPYCGNPYIVTKSIKGGILKIGKSKIQLTIKNIGGLSCTNVTVKIASNRGLILSFGTKEIVPSLSPGETVNITSSMIIGIGFLTKTLTITATEDSCWKKNSITKNALVFGVLWWC